jgi:endoglucanase
MSKPRRGVLLGGALLAVLLVVGILLGPTLVGRSMPEPKPTPTETASRRFPLPLDVDPQSLVAQEARTLQQQGSAADATAARTIAKYPMADWYGDFTKDVTASVRKRVTDAATRHAIATLVVYDIPDRDVGNYSAGGAGGDAAYLSFLRQFVAGLGSERAIVVLEPDAVLHSVSLLKPADRAPRLQLLKQAVELVAAQGSWVYLDAGAGWPPPARLAPILKRAGIGEAAGFSLNVSNFQSTPAMLQYGRSLSNALGKAHFVVDTSRNAIPGSGEQWCNPMPRGLGHAPTTDTGIARVDAFLWIKTPGQSDGTCNGGPQAGEYWPSYGRMLVEHAKLG